MAGGRPLILLDTCTLLWLTMAPEQLSPAARKALADPNTQVWVSPVTGFEIGQKHAAGKLELPLDPAEWMERALRSHTLDVMPLEMAIALRAAALPRLHNDPFDRLLIATAQEHHLVLLTPDPKIRAYPALKTRW